MRRIYLYSLLVALLAGCQKEESSIFESKPSVLGATMYDQGEPIPDRYIVVLASEQIPELKKRSVPTLAVKMDAVTNQIDRFDRRMPGLKDQIEHVYGAALTGFSVALDEDQVAKLRTDPNVSYIEQDRVIGLGPGNGRGKPSGGDEGPPAPQETPWGISRVNGGVSSGGKAYIIDTGIDLDHPDLNVSSSGFSVFARGKDKGLDDGHGHGTHVAGTVAAIDNEIGVIGVAAGALVVPVKVLDSRGSGSTSGVIAGVDYVAAEGKSGDVANMSLGGGASSALDDAVKRAAQNGIKFSLAAGNASEHANNYSPARANGANIYTVSAMSVGDQWATFSNYGNPPIDFCAPGVSVLSTWKGGGYRSISGTSMAAPHVAGILLLGNVQTDGTVNGDPDGQADPIASH